MIIKDLDAKNYAVAYDSVEQNAFVLQLFGADSMKLILRVSNAHFVCFVI